MSVRRAIAASVLACAALAFGAGPASAVREQTRDTTQDPVQVALERQVHERELALTAILDAAERHAKVEGSGPTGSRPSATRATSRTWSTSCRSTTTISRRASG